MPPQQQALTLCATSQPFMFRLTVILICFSFSISKVSFAGTARDTIIIPKNISKFIPSDYGLLDTATGDLNSDSYKDWILVLKTIGEDTAFDATEYKRPLLILIGQANNTFTLAARNDNVVYCYQCGGMFGDAYNGLEIKKGIFIVHHFGGSNERWSNDITFKYSKSDKSWYLLKIVDKGWSVFHLDKVETTIRTKTDFGSVKFDKYTDDIN